MEMGTATAAHQVQETSRHQQEQLPQQAVQKQINLTAGAQNRNGAMYQDCGGQQLQGEQLQVWRQPPPQLPQWRAAQGTMHTIM